MRVSTSVARTQKTKAQHQSGKLDESSGTFLRNWTMPPNSPFKPAMPRTQSHIPMQNAAISCWCKHPPIYETSWASRIFQPCRDIPPTRVCQRVLSSVCINMSQMASINRIDVRSTTIRVFGKSCMMSNRKQADPVPYCSKHTMLTTVWRGQPIRTKVPCYFHPVFGMSISCKGRPTSLSFRRAGCFRHFITTASSMLSAFAIRSIASTSIALSLGVYACQHHENRS